MKNKWIIEITSTLLICLWVYASSSKLFVHHLSAAESEIYPRLKHLAGLPAMPLPAAELSVAALLVFSCTRLVVLYVMAVLPLVFTAYLALMLLSDINLPYRCSEIISSLNWREHIVFNGVFIALAIIGIWFEKKGNYFIRGVQKNSLSGLFDICRC